MEHTVGKLLLKDMPVLDVKKHSIRRCKTSNYIKDITYKRHRLIMLLVLVCLLLTTVTVYADTVGGALKAIYVVGSTSAQFLVGSYSGSSGGTTTNIAIPIFTSILPLALAAAILLVLIIKMQTLKVGVSPILMIAVVTVFLAIVYLVIYNMVVVVRG